MKFIEVTSRLAAPVSHAGHVDDGRPLNQAIPSIGNVRIWQAVHGGYTWCIMLDPGHPSWSAAERAAFAGYSASYRKVGHNNSSQTIKIDDGPWSTQAQAETACADQWKRIRSAS